VRNHLKRSTWSVILAVVGIAAIAAAIAATATAKATKARAAAGTPTVQMVMGAFPQSLDPGLDYTSQGSEFNWLTHTGLTTYARAAGTGGAKLISGLATALPKITAKGKTYTMTLRKGLKFSDGTAVKASDFTYTVERAIKVPWGGSGAFITPYIVGATAYSKGKAKGISGIQTNDATGKIVIHLTQAYGPFTNVLAFPALGIIPAGTPMKVEPTSPPPGVGPYVVKNIVANQSFDFVKNPLWASEGIKNIPAGYVNVHVKINSNASSETLSVLNNSEDLMDWPDTIPGSLYSQIKAKASSRYAQVNLGGSTYYVFMNVTKAPFSSQLAREAVVTGLNQIAMSHLSSGTLQPACYFLPPAIPGHPTGPCPYVKPGLGNLSKAKKLVKQSGMAGTPVTVYSEERSPRLQWMTYYTQFLNQIGFKATLKQVADSSYWGTVGQPKAVDPQTGFADWNQDFPNPVDFYQPLLDGASILPQNNENFGQINDPKINNLVTRLGATPTTELGKVAGQWAQLEKYVAKKAYVAVFGYQEFPFFTSTKIKRSPLMENPIYGWDLSELQVK
jgi:peptide/nickel transport system substrate-binding protein